jgi:hypothetical protein
MDENYANFNNLDAFVKKQIISQRRKGRREKQFKIIAVFASWREQESFCEFVNLVKRKNDVVSRG